MKKRIQYLISLAALALPVLTYASLQPFTNNKCADLLAPKTVLLVHATWCGHCRAFLPTYEKVSNLEKYNDWTFYEMANDQFEKVCGTRIFGVPSTFKNNMQNLLSGNRAQNVLEEFLDK